MLMRRSGLQTTLPQDWDPLQTCSSPRSSGRAAGSVASASGPPHGLLRGFLPFTVSPGVCSALLYQTVGACSTFSIQWHLGFRFRAV